MAEVKLVNVPQDALHKLLAEIEQLVGKAESGVKKLSVEALAEAHKVFTELRAVVGHPRIG